MSHRRKFLSEDFHAKTGFCLYDWLVSFIACLTGHAQSARADDAQSSDLTFSVNTNNGGPRIDGKLWASPTGPAFLREQKKKVIKIDFGPRTLTLHCVNSDSSDHTVFIQVREDTPGSNSFYDSHHDMTWDECYKRLAGKADEVKNLQQTSHPLAFLDLLMPVGIRDSSQAALASEALAKSADGSGTKPATASAKADMTFCESSVDRKGYVNSVFELLKVKNEGPMVEADLVEALHTRFGIDYKSANQCAKAIMKVRKSEQDGENSSNAQVPVKQPSNQNTNVSR